MASQPATPAPAARTGSASRFRPDIEGLRAVAVGLVLLYHAGLSRLSGGFAGVDVFFVLSGFLITNQLVREVESTGTVSLPRFYARRAKRLFPAAAVVLATTALLVWRLVPRIHWEQIGGDIASAALYFVNWRLAARSVDYLAEDVDASPVQHFWSLAVEEQYYIVWPLLLLALAVLIRRGHLRPRPAMAIGLAAIVLPSFAWSVWATAHEPASAYFVTTTRLWELGIGALVAVGSGLWERLRPAAAAALGWAGLALVVVGALAQSTATPWPGYAALVPTLGTAAVVIAGFAAGSRGPVRLLGLPPMVWIGGLSYSLYLWHWPLLTVAALRWGQLSALQGLAIVALSVIPAWLTSRLVENPLRHARLMSERPAVALSVGANLTLAGVVAGLALSLAGARAAADSTAGSAPGASVLGTGERPSWTPPAQPGGPVTPNPLKATADVPEAYARGCQVDEAGTEPVECVFGVEDAATTVAVVGDSKIVQWLPAVQALAERKGWRVITYTKSACAFTDAMTEGNDGPYTQCRTWGEQVMGRLVEARPALVLTSGVKPTAADGRSSTLVKGYVDAWSELGRAGIPVVAVSDTPAPGTKVYECVAEHPDDHASACTFPRRPSAASTVLRTAADQVDTAAFAQMNDWVCPTTGDRCPPVVGGVLTYRQGSHITASYAGSLAPAFERRVLAAATKAGAQL